MQKFLGGIFFAAAAIYMAVTGSFNVITFLAVFLSACFAGLSAKNTFWAAAGGASLISGSLLLQTIYNYRCYDCLKADTLILCGVIALAVMEEGKLARMTRVLAGSMTAIMLVVLVLAAPPAHKSESSTPGQTSVRLGQNFERYLSVNDGQATVELDTQEKPVLLFSPNCGSCKKAVEKLVQADPRGEKWVAVQTGGWDQDGQKYLEDNGYRGKVYTLKGYSGPVPTFVSTRYGDTTLTHDVEQMLTKLGIME